MIPTLTASTSPAGALASSPVSRRTVATGLAWSVPFAASVTAAPFAAASAPLPCSGDQYAYRVAQLVGGMLMLPESLKSQMTSACSAGGFGLPSPIEPLTALPTGTILRFEAEHGFYDTTPDFTYDAPLGPLASVTVDQVLQLTPSDGTTITSTAFTVRDGSREGIYGWTVAVDVTLTRELVLTQQNLEQATPALTEIASPVVPTSPPHGFDQPGGTYTELQALIPSPFGIVAMPTGWTNGPLPLPLRADEAACGKGPEGWWRLTAETAQTDEGCTARVVEGILPYTPSDGGGS